MDEIEPVGYDEPQQHIAAFNLGDLKREEETLISLYSKMKDQLHKLEVEELELKQKIRRKELKETTEELFPPVQPEQNSDVDIERGKSPKGKALRKRRQNRTLSSSQDNTANEMDESMSVTSALSLQSPTKSLKNTPTPTRRSTRIMKDSPEKLKAARNLTIPSFEADKALDLDLSALKSFSLPSDYQHTDKFIESEDEDD